MTRRGVMIGILPMLAVPAFSDDCKEVDLTKIEKPVTTTFDALIHAAMKKVPVGELATVEILLKKTEVAPPKYELDYFLVRANGTRY